MIEIERLHPSEFGLLTSIGDGHVPNPDQSIVVVARNDSRIIARISLMAPTHAEGIYIEPEYRGKMLFSRLMAAVEVEARGEGITELFAYAINTDIGNYLLRTGYRLRPWSVFSKELK
jgi:N-acetylglutamate synthase-like GNAT family acetyltransferase